MMNMQKGAETDVARDLRKQVSEIGQQITEKAVLIVHEKMPRKIMALQALAQVRESDAIHFLTVS